MEIIPLAGVSVELAMTSNTTILGGHCTRPGWVRVACYRNLLDKWTQVSRIHAGLDVSWPDTVVNLTGENGLQKLVMSGGLFPPENLNKKRGKIQWYLGL